MGYYFNNMRKGLVICLMAFVLFSCNKSERHEKMLNNDRSEKDQIIGMWDVVSVGIVQDGEETDIYDAIASSDKEEVGDLELIEKKFVRMMTIFYNSNRSIKVKYSGDDFEDEEGYWSISTDGKCRIVYGCGECSVNSDITITKEGNAYFYANDGGLKIYIEKIQN